VSRADGIGETELDALRDPAASTLFDDREQAALAYAEAITTGNTVPDEVFERVRQHFNDDEIVELTAPSPSRFAPRNSTGRSRLKRRAYARWPGRPEFTFFHAFDNNVPPAIESRPYVDRNGPARSDDYRAGGCTDP
jgi:hypothetical protein